MSLALDPLVTAIRKAAGHSGRFEKKWCLTVTNLRHLPHQRTTVRALGDSIFSVCFSFIVCLHVCLPPSLPPPSLPSTYLKLPLPAGPCHPSLFVLSLRHFFLAYLSPPCLYIMFSLSCPQPSPILLSLSVSWVDGGLPYCLITVVFPPTRSVFSLAPSTPLCLAFWDIILSSLSLSDRGSIGGRLRRACI